MRCLDSAPGPSCYNTSIIVAKQPLCYYPEILAVNRDVSVDLDAKPSLTYMSGSNGPKNVPT